MKILIFGLTELTALPSPPPSPATSPDLPDQQLEDKNENEIDQFKLRPLTCKKRKGEPNLAKHIGHVLMLQGRVTM